MEVALTNPPKIHAAMIAVMRDTGAIGKDKINQVQRFKFRGIDDMYNHLQKIKAKHGVFELPEVLEDRTEERTTKGGSALIYRVLKIRYQFFAEDGSSVSAVVIGEGMDSGDKASNKAMAVAHKYALIQAFNIPTEDIVDPDSDNPEGKEGLSPKEKRNQEKGPRSTALYTGANEQKRELAQTAARVNITDPSVLKQLSQFCMHTPMSQLPIQISKFKTQSKEKPNESTQA